MKAFISAASLFCLAIISTVLVAIYANKALTDFDAFIDESLEENPTNISIIEEKYKDIKPFLILFMHEKDVKEMEMYIADIKNAVQKNNTTSLHEAKSRLKLHIKQLRRQSVFSIEAIF